MKNVLFKSFLAIAAVLLLSTAYAKGERVYSSKFTGAIRGYDAVAYFTMGKPVRGKKSITHDYLGATWRFANDEHKKLFAANPEKYAPQYGGYCAKGIADNRLVTIDPKAWTIVDDKLYLNYSRSVKKTWNASSEQYIAVGDQNWKAKLQSEFGIEY